MKMTTKEDTEGDTECDSRLAAYLAVHLVKQILDDAYVIANSALESNTQLWGYQSTVTNEKQNKNGEEDGDTQDGDDEDEGDDDEVSLKADSDIVNENKIELVANIVATSTPQKVTTMIFSEELEKSKPESASCCMIGQGDEAEMRHRNDLATSMLINHLFDMSEVETVIVCEEAEVIHSDIDSSELLTQAMTNIMDTYINAALSIALKQAPQNVDDAEAFNERSQSSEYSEYSFLSDAFVTDIGGNLAFYIQDPIDAVTISSNHCELPIIPGVKITEVTDNENEIMASTNVARLENAYLSLNRDYEQCSEDDGNLIYDDPKGMTLQEVELLTADTSDDNISTHDETTSDAKDAKKLKELQAISAVSANSRKSIVSRCRSQGARLLACLRGWWRRRTPGKRKEHQHRASGKCRGLCPLSPEARSRAASLLDQRMLRSPLPSRPQIWKFNTVNETVVNSTRWKDYTFDVKPDETVEY